MITEKELFNKYSTGSVYISPAAMDYDDSRLRTYYWCYGSFKEIMRELMIHLLFPPTDRCFKFPKIEYDGVLRPGNVEMTEKEMGWLWVEYKLRTALNSGYRKNKVYFTVTER